MSREEYNDDSTCPYCGETETIMEYEDLGNSNDDDGEVEWEVLYTYTCMNCCKHF